MTEDIRTVAEMLNQHAQVLSVELLPSGCREGAEWRAGSLAGDPGRRLSVRLFGPKAGRWIVHNSNETGDMLDLVAAIRFGGSLPAALQWARAWLGLDGSPSTRPRIAPPPVQHAGSDLDADQRKAAARRAWTGAQAALVDTPTLAYLMGRLPGLIELGRLPGVIRHHPALWCAEANAKLPAMVAAVIVAGEHTGTHRTWLQQDDAGRWMKAKIAAPKKSLGLVAGGVIPVWVGELGLPLARASDGETAVLAEGIETALACAIACPELRVLSTVSLGNMERVILPAAIGEVIIAADNDANPKVREVAERAAQRLIGEGRRVRIARPHGVKDFADLLLSVGA